jgi:hypothetical protein
MSVVKIESRLSFSSLSQNRLVAVGFILVFACLGVYLLTSSHAATPESSVEAETGTLGNGASVVSDSSASNGSYVKFVGASDSDSNLALFNTEDYNNGVALTDGSFYQVMDLQYDGSSGDPSYSPTYFANLHRENPNVIVLIYIDPIFGCLGVADGSVDGLANMGSSSYQSACMTKAISLDKSTGADGIWWDDENATGSWDTTDGKDPSDYPTDADWESGVESFLSYAQTQLHANGLVSMGNIGDWQTGNTAGIMWQTYGKYLDGELQESWDSTGTGAQSTSYWMVDEEEALWSSSQDKYDMIHDYANSSQTDDNLGLASMLLVAPSSNDRDSFSTSIVTDNAYKGNESSYPEFTTAKDLGAPTNSVSPDINPLATNSTGAGTNASVPEAQNTVYSRAFANGIVLVNPTGSSLSYTLPSGTYSGSGTEPTNLSGTITVPSATGYVLLKN